MKHIIAYLFVLCGFSLTAQTARLDCFNCTAVPKEVCIPCQTGKASTEYSQGIMYTAGPSNKTFIKKPYTMTVSGVFITLTDYTGKTITFDGTKTVHGSLTNTINTINICNCPVVGGGGGGPFTIGGDTGSGSFTTGFTMATGPVLKTTASGSTVTIDWDVTAVAAHSVPYYNGSNVAFRTFATGILDDPTVGGVDATSLQTVVNNLNTAIGGGGGGGNGIYGGSGNIPADGSPVIATVGAAGAGNFLIRHNGTGTVAIGDDLGNDNAYISLGARPELLYSNTGLNNNAQIGMTATGSVLSFATFTSPTIGSYVVATKTESYIGTQDNVTDDATRILFSKSSIIGQVAPNFDGLTTSYINGFRLDDQRRFWLGDGATAYHMPLTGPPGFAEPYVIEWTSTTPAWALAPRAITKYVVSVAGGNTGSNLTIVSSGTGVTASFASNKLTIVIPTGVRVLSADWRLVSGDVQASADAGGVTNWVVVEFQGTENNTTIDNINIPSMQKVAIPASGALSVSNAATADFDNNPALSVIGVGSGNITLRVGGLSVGAQGYHLKFSGI